MTTLFDLTYKAAEMCGNLRESKATGGSTTALIDNSALRTEDNDYFNGGTIWITKTTDGLAPQGQYARITDYNSTSKTFTLLDTLSAVVEAGDYYAVSNSRFPLWLLIQKINRRVAKLGLIPTVDTSITLEENRREYTLPVAASLDLLQVHVQTEKTVANKNIWMPVYNWNVQYSASGAAETLVLAYDLTAGYKLKLDYGAIHPELRLYNDVLNEVIHPDLVVYDAAADCLTWYMDKTHLKDYQQTRDDLRLEAEIARTVRPFPQLPPRQSKIGLPGVWT